MKPGVGTMVDGRSMYRRRWSTPGVASRAATAPSRRHTTAGSELRPRAELPAWNDALSRVVSLLGTLQEHIGKVDAADVPAASAEPSNVGRGQLLRDIEKAQQTARNAQRRVAEALGTAAAGQDSVKP
jgi:hypothetical protein